MQTNLKSLQLLAGIALITAVNLAQADTSGHERYPGHYLDYKGDRIEHRLDRKGDRIDWRLDRAADQAASHGRDGLARKLDRKGDRIDHRLDNRGHRIERRLDHRGRHVARHSRTR